jgi:hypothetical protein
MGGTAKSERIRVGSLSAQAELHWQAQDRDSESDSEVAGLPGPVAAGPDPSAGGGPWGPVSPRVGLGHES